MAWGERRLERLGGRAGSICLRTAEDDEVSSLEKQLENAGARTGARCPGLTAPRQVTASIGWVLPRLSGPGPSGGDCGILFILHFLIRDLKKLTLLLHQKWTVIWTPRLPNVNKAHAARVAADTPGYISRKACVRPPALYSQPWPWRDGKGPVASTGHRAIPCDHRLHEVGRTVSLIPTSPALGRGRQGVFEGSPFMPSP